jgi:hypothetical protein
MLSLARPLSLPNPAVAMLLCSEIMTAPWKWFLKKDEARIGN